MDIRCIVKAISGMARFLLLFGVVMFLGVSLISATTIRGTLYDLALQQESDVVVEIDTVPNQFMISKDGHYSFNVNPGNYTLHAYTSTSEAFEPLVVVAQGDYVLDIVLEDKISMPLTGISLTDPDMEVSSSIPNANKTTLLWILLVMLLVVLIVALLTYIFWFHRKTTHPNMRGTPERSLPDKDITDKASSDVRASDIKTETDEYEHKVLLMIKREKRTTQKDVRKEVPLSEAKISLILTDLEDKGKIRKIKKGRGNVLIFVKD